MKQVLAAAGVLAAMSTGHAQAEAPRLAPTHDVTIDYAVIPRDHAPIDVRVSIAAGGALLRITAAELPTAFLIDRPARTATILLPMLKLYSTVGIGRYDLQETVLHNAHFERQGHEFIAGRPCTDWIAISERGHAAACITEDGVILRGTAYDHDGEIGKVRASTVAYDPLPPNLFRRPSDFNNAGRLPIGDLNLSGQN